MTMRPTKSLLPLLLLLASLPAVASAGLRPVAEQAKIDKLISEVRDSGGTFIRNGDEFDSVKAADHLRRKLDYAGAKIQTAREFITGVASRSERSGEPYLLRLPGSKEPIPLRDWLAARLDEMESRERTKPHGSG